jgi:hypothetical protein
MANMQILLFWWFFKMLNLFYIVLKLDMIWHYYSFYLLLQPDSWSWGAFTLLLFFYNKKAGVMVLPICLTLYQVHICWWVHVEFLMDWRDCFIFCSSSYHSLVPSVYKYRSTSQRIQAYAISYSLWQFSGLIMLLACSLVLLKFVINTYSLICLLLTYIFWLISHQKLMW